MPYYDWWGLRTPVKRVSKPQLISCAAVSCSSTPMSWGRALSTQVHTAAVAGHYSHGPSQGSPALHCVPQLAARLHGKHSSDMSALTYSALWLALPASDACKAGQHCFSTNEVLSVLPPGPWPHIVHHKFCLHYYSQHDLHNQHPGAHPLLGSLQIDYLLRLLAPLARTFGAGDLPPTLCAALQRGSAEAVFAAGPAAGWVPCLHPMGAAGSFASFMRAPGAACSAKNKNVVQEKCLL